MDCFLSCWKGTKSCLQLWRVSDWTNLSSLRQYLNDILHLISQIIVTKVAQLSLPPCSTPQQMLCWLVFPEGHCGKTSCVSHMCFTSWCVCRPWEFHSFKDTILFRFPRFLSWLHSCKAVLYGMETMCSAANSWANLCSWTASWLQQTETASLTLCEGEDFD